jgi:hypothetical protein
MFYQGIPAILMGFVCLFFLPARPEATNYLTEKERELAIDRMNRSTSGDIGPTVNKAHITAALKDWRVSILKCPSAVTFYDVYSADLCCRCDLFRCKQCPRIHLCILAHHPPDARLQFVPINIGTDQLLIYYEFTAKANAQLLTVPPYVCAAIVLLLFAYFSDRQQSRGLYVTAACGIAGIGYMYVIQICPKQVLY